MKLYLRFSMLLLASLFFLNNLSAQYMWSASANIDVNNVNAHIRIGDLWYKGYDGQYLVPKDDPNPKASIFAGGLWMGGIDPAGNFEVTTSTYGASNGNPSYWAGPVNPITGTTNLQNVQNWDLMFEIYSSEIALHVQDYEDNNVIDGPVAENVLGWPGRGNLEFFYIHGFHLPDQDLAPFVDRDNDGFYEPMEGDFPLIKGEKAVWWVFNDIAQPNPSGTNATQVEVQAMAFAYSSSEDYLNNATFYDFKLINRGPETLNSFVASLWVDPDLGCNEDDYVGCSPDNDLAYVYNADDFDEDCEVNGYGTDIPVLGIRLLKGLEDAQGNGPGFSNFMYFGGASFPDPDPGQGEPAPGELIHGFMNGIWSDGTPLTQGGSGYNPGSGLPPYSYAYDGSKLDSIGLPWTECALENEHEDRRMLISSGSITFNPGDVRYLSYGVMWSQDVSYPCPDLSDFFTESDELQDFYDNIDQGPNTSTTALDLDSDLIKIAPNPASDVVNLSMNLLNHQMTQVEVFNVAGQLVFSSKGINANEFQISTTSWSRGVFYLRVLADNGQVQTRKLMLQ